MPTPEPARTPEPTPEASFASPQRVAALDAQMAYREAGRRREGAPTFVFLHGNPTSSYLWRDVVPHVAGLARCLAPDLVGMGDSSKPEIAYRFDDHARYLDAWFDALGLGDVVLVGHDWGGALAMNWATRHPGRVRGLALLETILRPMHWSEWPPQGAEFFRALRTPGAGEAMVLEENQFLARSLAAGVKRGLTDEARAVYYAPYPDPRSRTPLLQWPRELPIDGEPADVVRVVERYDAWLASSNETPKLLLAFDAGTPLGSPAAVEWARTHVASLEIVSLGPAGHHAPEDAPGPIGAALATWARQRGLMGAD